MAARTVLPPTPWLAGPVLALLLAPSGFAGEATPCSPLEGAEAEAFLRTAAVVARSPIGSGITRSERLTLSNGSCTARAAWKKLHQRVMGLQKMADGRTEFDFRDSWKHDVAAYELDKLLGLGLVPPTIERRIGGLTGALQLWIEGAMNDLDRRRRHVEPPDRARFEERCAAVLLLRELAYDTDYNVQNTLIGPEFRVYAIDFSRAFRIQPGLLSPERLHRFPRAAIERLRTLDRASFQQRLSPWLDRLQITALDRRREQILALVDRQVAARGEDAILIR